MNNRHSFQIRLAHAVALTLLLVISSPAISEAMTHRPHYAPGQQTTSEETFDANTLVKRGIILSEHPLAHLTLLQESERVGMPQFNAISRDERLQLAIRDFRRAIQKRRELNGYTVSQVYAFLGRALRLLGTELQREAEQSPQKSQVLRAEAQRSFEDSFQQYRLAIKNDSGSLKYTFAQDLVQAIIFSGDLNRALISIAEFERERLEPTSAGDHGLIKMKGDIYSILGRYEEAGRAYEEWIRRGHVDVYLMPGDAFYEKLRNLKRKTGHPNNLPS